MDSISQTENKVNWKCFKNYLTGQVIYKMSGKAGRFETAIRKQANYVRLNWNTWYMKHMILTIAKNVSEVDFHHLNRVLDFIRKRVKRAGGKMSYIWVKELQKRGAAHYHVLIVLNKPYIMPSSREIAGSWNMGYVKVTFPRKRISLYKLHQYLAKYIGKGYDFNALQGKRSFGTSSLPSLYKMSFDKVLKTVKKLGRRNAELLQYTYSKGHIAGYEGDEMPRKRVRIPLIGYKSAWLFQGEYPDPF